jgi:NAD(P)-dependent dehydrogenase (short-subunit alcohol dehydrogenase family)
MDRLAGKVAVVTGAGSGNGRAFALGYAAEGAAVLAADIDRDGLEATADLVEKAGGKIETCLADVTSSQSVREMFDASERAFGKIDILMSNAGIIHRTEFLDLTEEIYDRVMAVNLKGVFLCGLEGAKRMAASGGGAIVNIASINSLIAASNTAVYCASKGGVQMLTRSMAVSLAPHRIRVNAIAPGTIRTNINRDRLSDPAVVEAESRRMPLGRLGMPEDLIGAAVFLASDDAAYITGHTLVVDGGLTITWNAEHPLAPAE